jgi:hypothetical protein
MATTPTGLDVPAGIDPFDPDGDIRDLAASLEGRIFVPVPNITARDALAAALSPTPAEPLYVDRADAPAGAKLERTTDGVTWSAPTFTRVSHQKAGDPPGGVDVPTVAVTDVNARMIRKTGVATFTTTTGFGNEYGPLVIFPEPFPTSLLYVSMTQIHTGGVVAFAGAVATDRASRIDFRAVYVGSGAPTLRGFIWEAVGY